jgi:hypothetical protein
MTIRKTVVAALALGLAVSFAPLAQAAAISVPGSQPAAERVIHIVKMKKKMKSHRMHRMAKRHRGHRRAASHRGCGGTYMYRKHGKCMDARNK